MANKPQVLSPLPELLVGTSTKMYFSHERTKAYLKNLFAFSYPTRRLEVFFIPTFTSLAACGKGIAKALTARKLLLGAQDCHWESEGAHTGSVSPAVLAEIGCVIVELGHAERRRPPISETDELVAKKARAAVREGLVPLVCVGEVSRPPSDVSVEDGHQIALAEVKKQVSSILSAVDGDKHIIFAYEPVWAIGADRPANPDHVRGVALGIKALAAGRSGDVRVLYGGSAGPGTWQGLKKDDALDGLFLGRFAHDIANFSKTIREVGEDSVPLHPRDTCL